MNSLLRKALLLIGIVFSFQVVSAQSALRQKIQGELSLSSPVTRLAPSEQVPFQPQRAAQLIGLEASSDLKLVREERDQLGVNYRFQQIIQGIPVENSMYIVQTKQGKATVMSGAIILDLNPDAVSRTTPQLTAEQAIQRGLSLVHAVRYAWEDAALEDQVIRSGEAGNRPTAELVWFSGVDQLDAGALQLAYKVTVYALEPLSRAAYYFDANDGNYLGTKDLLFFADAVGTAATVYSGTQTIHSDSTGSTNFRLRDLTKGNGVITLHGETSSHLDYTSTTPNWSYTTNDKYALDAHFGVSSTWSFYHVNFGRNSINNAGFALTSYVNETATTNNAYWDGSTMHYGIRSTTNAGITAIDVTAHELTHGITQYTSGLNYSSESGAINESMSDIFGKAVQFWAKPTDINWLLSNDMNWAIRNMANPKQYSQPNCYTGTYWYTGTADNGGVHTNSGVGNYFYYLLVNGGVATNDKGNAYTVVGLGLTKANAIIYRSETSYLTPTSNYAAWRTACINAAIDLYGAVSNEVDQVKNAWYAVGVGSAANACDAATGLSASTLTTTSATLSWTASTTSNYTLQWKPTTSTSWNVVTGLTTNSYSLQGLSTCTGYQFQVQNVCSGIVSSAFSTTTTFTTTGCPIPAYCTSAGTNTTTRGYINRVTLGTISNTSGNNNGYADYTSLSTNLVGRASASISMTPGFPSTTSNRMYWVVWIDYNKNGVFTDAGEKVATGNSTSTLTKTFTVPSTALNGTTRMRVQMQYNTATTSSCQTYTNGEVEDYTVNITGNAAFGFVQEPIGFEKDVLAPNPADDHARWEYQSLVEGNIRLNIYSADGKLVRSFDETLTEGMNSWLIDTKELPNGFYFVTTEGVVRLTHRIVIQH